MKLFDYIFYKSYTSKWKKFHNDKVEAESNVMILIASNIGSLGYLIYTLFFNNDSSIYILMLSLIGGCIPGYIIAHYMFTYKDRYKKVLRKFADAKIPKGYTLGIWSYVLFTIGFFFSVIVIKIELEDSLLKNNSVYARAVITDLQNDLRGHDFITYNYLADGYIYSRQQTYDRYYNHHIRVGDTCNIIYSRSKPGISELLKVSNREIIIVNRRGNYKLNILKKDSAYMRMKKTITNSSNNNLK